MQESDKQLLLKFTLGKKIEIQLFASHIPTVPPNKNFFNINIPRYTIRVIQINK